MEPQFFFQFCLYNIFKGSNKNFIPYFQNMAEIWLLEVMW